MKSLNEIWEGDKLDRKNEAVKLERFLINETETLKRLGRQQSFVLALDAQYGEGKSWFLDRLAQQLAINHPVAFVDAWVDDANNEPLVSIMSALDDALQPFLKSQKVKDKLGDLTRAALPILGKAALSAGGKFVSRYIGENIGVDAQSSIDVAKSKRTEEALQAGLDKAVENINEVVDSAGKALLDQYRSRRKSREAFKSNLQQLAASIEKTDVDPRHSPIFVVVDELDRCRPDYAIALLESIKHLFDVPGIVFIIALHGKQLTASIDAVYGAKFDSTSYLRRFFSRHYELRRLSIGELVASMFNAVDFPSDQFSAPLILEGITQKEANPADLAGGLLTEWSVTPREAQAIIDGLRLFVSNWDHKNVRIELPLVLILLFHLIRGSKVQVSVDSVGNNPVKFCSYDYDARGHPTPATSKELVIAYLTGQGQSLNNLPTSEERGLNSYVTMTLRQEYQIRYNSTYHLHSPEPKSTWSEYKERVCELIRFIDIPE
ncbi:P-loop NTPase fold protein [Sphingobium yanoikuyae]|uniref:KAP family P-loop NTPase fold protein n=1 Tax=Sphingobium yanoikuyae TaxID=13690 RepID=UPI0028A858CE|nr:P-loop NTPase fold protein [Sphingobium yanoikuyae]